MPQLVLTADPSFANLALAEASQNATDVSVIAELAPGVFLLNCLEGFWGLAESWRLDSPIFVRHANPVDLTVPLEAVEADLHTLVDGAELELMSLVEPELPFSVQTRILTDLPYKPYDVNKALSQQVQARSGAPLDVRHPIQILSIVCASLPESLDLASGFQLSQSGHQAANQMGHPPPTTRHTYYAFLGLSLAAYNLSDWAGGERRFAREKGQISRAEFKLLEALEVFGIDLPARGVALDLGASPGGWTRVLRQRDQFVTAVDPAELDRRLAEDRGVRHKRMTAEAYLADEPDTFDLMVNDMRMDARDSARLMLDYAPHLYPHGLVIMTFKLPEQGRRPILDHAFTILRNAYQIVAARQLFHNRSEITVYLRRR